MLQDATQGLYHSCMTNECLEAEIRLSRGVRIMPNNTPQQPKRGNSITGTTAWCHFKIKRPWSCRAQFKPWWSVEV